MQDQEDDEDANGDACVDEDERGGLHGESKAQAAGEHEEHEADGGEGRVECADFGGEVGEGREDRG